MPEQTDVVVVGSRCAGTAAAITLARRNRKVIAVDSAAFPSDTLSTHLFFTHHWAELDRLGARERVAALGAPLHTRAGLGSPDVEVIGPSSRVEGFAAGACVRRPGLDLALVETARAAGAEVREHVRVTGLMREASGRVCGVRIRHRDGTVDAITAKLVVGADGRRSTVAKLVGARDHHRWDNQRIMAFAYYDDPRGELRDLAMQWRDDDDLVTVFPCDGGQSVVLLMPPRYRTDEFRADATAAFDATVQRIAPFAERLAGCTRVTDIRMSYSHPSYFRHSQGPGWALAGDAGHFKDPVTAQGIRDALRFGRLLGEAAAAVLDDPARLDSALAAWERDRDAQCLAMYQWANLLGRADTISPIENAAYHWFAARPDGFTELADVFNRKTSPQRVFTPARLVRWAAAAARDPGVGRGELARTVGRDVRREAARIVEQVLFAKRRAASARASSPRPTGRRRLRESPEPMQRPAAPAPVHGP
ncbi:NAD(P)/FAD-dependent oxidoreductase [Mycobacterium sp. Y57]|uniref:NAD(P)/FAD-dependent oxidoreductase n=1 Tax=Mycolicibacterium xanthum TaxID=2796469 RepID=UPI001C860F18|nr:NAD(P)/FAD-dependent oxidoreductase [Mycolicibacterium xanthum]MBX7431837.1 NAD(P)/FAD-dependent oxidoreductase [Mycolicibacterium xanthum]